MKKEFMSSTFSKNPLFDYMPDEDKYLFKKEKPVHNFVVIGSGMIGLEHIKCTLLEGRASIYGIYDRSKLSLEKTVAACKEIMPDTELVVYDDLDKACSDPNTDAILITTPNYSHIEILRTAIKYNKHIFMEKPMATTLKDAYEIVEIAKKHNKVLQIGLQYRYKAMYSEAIYEALERKSLGSIKNIFIMEHRLPFLDKVDQWNKFSKYSGGTFVEKCCHYFDLFNLFAQSKPKTVYAVGSQAVNYKDFEFKGEKSDILDNGTVIVTYENGVVATFNLCMFAPMFYEEFVVCGDEGRLKAYENDDYLPDVRPQTFLEILHGEGGKPTKIMTPCYPEAIQSSGHHGGTFYEHRYFIDNIEGKPTTTATVEDGFWSVVVGIAAEESVKTGTIINISELLKQNNINI